MRTIAFFNNKGGVGKTSLVYHLAYMLSELGHIVIAADLDPQANLTAMMIPEDEIEGLWTDAEIRTIYGCVDPLRRGTGDIVLPLITGESPGLIAGDLRLSGFEDKLSYHWSRCLDGEEDAFRITSAFYRIVHGAAEAKKADYVLIDVGPNLGAINRAALIASDFIVIPMSPDLYSIQGLRNLGPTLRGWKEQWEERIAKNRAPSIALPSGRMEPMGYVVMQHAEKKSSPVKAYARWIDRMPNEYRVSVLREEIESYIGQTHDDPHCLALLKHYRSLMPFAMEVRKPMFSLTPADGAIGAHAGAVLRCYQDFRTLAERIISSCGNSGAWVIGQGG